MRRAVRQQRCDAVRLPGDGVHGQLLPESLLFPPVGEPVVDPYLRHQVGAETLSFGRGDASLQTLGPGGQKKLRLTLVRLGELAHLG